MKAWWGIVLLPAVAGVVVAVLAAQGVLANPVLYLRGRLDVCALAAGIVLSLLAAVFLGLAVGAQRRRQRAVQQLRDETTQERSRFLQRLDHELKNPLTALRAQLTEALTRNPSSGQQETLAAAETQVIRLSQLTADLRKLADLETHPLRRVSIDVDELVQEALALVENQPGANARNMQHLVPRVPRPPSFPGDWDLVLQAIHNLLTNAIKFTRPGDRIEIRASETDEMVAVAVADTGPGISDKDLPHLGEELFRGQGARDVPGSGLGLALVQSIVERHHGQWEISSQEGVGTTITLRFPKK